MLCYTVPKTCCDEHHCKLDLAVKSSCYAHMGFADFTRFCCSC